MSEYYDANEKVELVAFLQIPKLLFDDKYKKLSMNARLMYSLYLNRYLITKYKDKDGVPYIIFSDDDINSKLGITRMTCIRIKKQLEELNLITLKKSVGHNMVYLHNPSVNENDEPTNKSFYTVDDFKRLQFYKFPLALLDKKFDKLNINTKMLYTYYLDYISLSQAHEFIDEQGRVFFYDDFDNQGSDIQLSQRTISTCRRYLFISNLLYKHHPWSAKTKYYLKKLDLYNEENLEKYLEASKEEQDKMLKEYTVFQDEEFNVIHIGNNVTEEVVDYEKMLQLDIDLTNSENLLQLNLQNSDNQFRKTVTFNEQKDDNQIGNNVTIINNTNSKETKSNETDSVKELNNLINQVIRFCNSIDLSDKAKTDFLKACFEKLKTSQEFTFKNISTQMRVYYDRDDIVRELRKIDDEGKLLVLVSQIFMYIEKGHYEFKSPDSQINCFLTFLFNTLDKNNSLDNDVPNWFKPKLKEVKVDTSSMFSEEIKNYNWWDNN